MACRTVQNDKISPFINHLICACVGYRRFIDILYYDIKSIGSIGTVAIINS